MHLIHNMTILRVQLYIVVFFCLIFVYQCLFGKIKIIIAEVAAKFFWKNVIS